MNETKLKLKLDPKHFVKKDFIDIKPMGFLEPEDDPNDFRFGAITKIPDEIIRPDGQYLDIQIEKECQAKNGVETMGCTFFGSNNATEITAKAKYPDEPEMNNSDRAGNILAGNTKNGNSPKKPAEVLNNIGIPPEKSLPFDNTIKTWEQYHSPKPLPQNLLNECAKWLKKWEFMYEWVNTDKESLKAMLKRGALGISVTAWQMRNGLYFNDNINTNNHWCTLIGYEEGKCWFIFDSYDAWVKKLEWNYKFKYAMHYYIKKKLSEVGPENLPQEKNMKTIKFKTDPRIFIVSNVDSKKIIWVSDGDDTSWDDYLKMVNYGWIPQQPEIIDDSLFATYQVEPFRINGDLFVDITQNPFGKLLDKIIDFFKGLFK